MNEPQGYIDVVDDAGRVNPLTVQTHTIIPAEQLARNIRENLKRPVLRFHARPGGLYSVRHGALAIVAAGPSLRETINRVRDFEYVLVCGSAHDYVVRAGIVPTYALVADGGMEDKGNLSLPQQETNYLIASQCDPGLFEHLSGHKVEMWHYKDQCARGEEEVKLLGGEPSLAWGGSVGVLAISIAMALGFQHLHFFGLDSCYGDFGLAHHCTQIAGAMEGQKTIAKVGKHEFISDVGLMEQSNQYFRLVEVYGKYFHSTIHGGGLIAAMVEEGDPELSEYITLMP